MKHSKNWVSQNFGAFIEGVHRFDENIFGVSKSEASFMDPQQRILLECVYQVIGCMTEDLSSCAVAVGVSYNEYFLNLLNMDNSGLIATSGTLSVLSGRVSYTFDLNGPSKSIDTACSSSLVCIHLCATSSMANGSRNALACGINLLLRHETSWVLAGARMLSEDGRCKTLDRGADGYGRAEGCAVHLLTVESLQEDSQITIFLAGTSVGQDGRSSSLTAPNGPAQQRVIRGALKGASETSLSIDMIEMHGTGTALGDPIEIGALSAIFGGNASLRLQAVKSTTLHSEPAAGAIGMINGIEAVFRSTTSIFANLVHLNVYVSRALSFMTRNVFQVPRTMGPAANRMKSSKQFIGVSSFAFQGTNTHVIVKKMPGLTSARVTNRKCPLQQEFHWWTFLNVPLFSQAYPKRGSIQVIAFTGNLTPNNSWLLHGAGACPRIPAAMITSLGARICYQMAFSDILLSNLSLSWVKGNINDSFSLSIDLHTHRLSVEIVEKSTGQGCLICKSSILQLYNSASKKPELFKKRHWIPVKHTEYFDSRFFIWYSVEYHCRDVRVGHGSMRAEIISEVAMQPFMQNSQHPLNLPIRVFSLPGPIFQGYYLCYAVRINDMCQSTCGMRLEGIHDTLALHIEEDKYDMRPFSFDSATKLEISDIVRKVFEDVIGFVDEMMHFGDIGIDSIASVELRRALENVFNTTFPATLIYDYPNIDSLVSYIFKHIGGTGKEHVKIDQIYLQRDPKAVAILTLSGNCGGSQANKDLVSSLWENTDRINSIPTNRWDLSAYSAYSSQSVITLGCWMSSIDKFDNRLLGVKELESKSLDPQVRVLLEAVCEALIPQFPSTSRSSPWGTYVGCVWTEFPEFIRQTTFTKDISYLTGSGLNFSSGRISFTFDLKGPCVGVDTACSSSLVALLMAQNAMQGNTIDYSVSGGTNLMLLPSTTLNLQSLGSLSSSGRSQTLDIKADGYGRGEGCVAVICGVMHRGNRSIAYLRGSSCNQDGRSTSLTAPNGPSQSVLLRITLREGLLDANEVSYLNLHGTGTALGDPIEIGALSNVFDSSGSSYHLASVKSSICHTEGSAGLHGVAGAISCLSINETMSFHCLSSMNPYIEQILKGKSATFICSRQGSTVPLGESVASTVSSYGMSGTNACCALQSVCRDIMSSHDFRFARADSWPCISAVRYKFHTNTYRDSTGILECLLGAKYAYLSDHTVAGKSIVPGAGMFWLSLTAITDCFYSEFACLAKATINSPIPINSNLILAIKIDLVAGEIRMGPGMSHPSLLSNLSSKITWATSPPKMPQKNISRYNIFSKWHWTVTPEALSNIKLSDEEKSPAILDSSIHLAPAALMSGGNEPRAVVGVEIFNISSCLGAVVSPLVQRNDTSDTILTHHFGLNHDGNSTLHHRIYNLQAKRLGAVPRQVTEDIVGRYAVVNQADRTFGNDFDRSDHKQLLLKLFGTYSSITLKCKPSRTKHAISASRLTQAVQVSLGRKHSLRSVEVVSMSSIPNRVGLGIETYSHDIRSAKSYLNVLKNEFGHVKSRALTFDHFSLSSFDQPQNSSRDSDISLQDNFMNIPILLKEDGPPSNTSEAFRDFFVTGGTGALGTLILSWAVEEPRNVGSFLGRSGRVTNQVDLPIKDNGVMSCIRFIKADNSKRDDLADCLVYDNSIPGIILHAAGVLYSKLIPNIDLESIKTVFASKVAALDTITSHLTRMPIQACQLFSSLAAFEGIHGQSVYASANAILDASGDGLVSRGIPILSVQWGNWGGKGMAADDHAFTAIMKQMGLGMIHPSNGLTNLESLLFQTMDRSEQFRFSTLMVNIFLLDTMKHTFRDVPFILRDLIKKTNKANDLHSVPKIDTSKERYTDFYSSLLAVVKSLDIEVLPGGDLTSSGLDSLTLNSFVNAIHDNFGIRISPTEVFNYSDFEQLGSFLYSELGASLKSSTYINSDNSYLQEIAMVITALVFDKTGVRLDPDEPLLASGLNSMSVTNLSSLLSEKFKFEILQTDLIDYPTVIDLSKYIFSKTISEGADNSVPLSLSVDTFGKDSPVGIRSISYIYPCHLNDNINHMSFISEFSYDNVRAVPLNRWDKDAHSGLTSIRSLSNSSGMSTIYRFSNYMVLLI